MTPNDQPGSVGASPTSSEVAPRRRTIPVPSGRAIAATAVLTAIGIALDGVAGAMVGVVIVAVVLARLPRKVIGLAGVAALAGAPIVVLVRGVPAAADVSPAFVTGSLLAHHLTFAGLSLTGTWVVLDLLVGLKVAPAAPVAEASSTQPIERLGDRARVVLVLVVVIAAVAAIVGAWTQ